MAVNDRKVHKDAKSPLKHVTVPIITAVSQTGTAALITKPGYGFEIVGVETYCNAKAGTVTADVLIGGQSALAAAATFTAGSRVAASLHGTVSRRRGSDASDISVTYATDGIGSLTNGFVVLTLRPYPMHGDVE